MKNKLRLLSFLVYTVLVLSVLNLVVFFCYQKPRVDYIESSLEYHETIKKANTADTINKIERKMFSVIDYRLDRLDSVLNLPH